MFKLLISAVLLVASVGAHSQSAVEMVPIEDLQSHWLTVDRTGKSYVPYVLGSSLNYPVIGLLLNTTSKAGLILECCVPQGTSVFVNNQIVDHSDTRICRFYNIDSLGALYAQDDVFISFYKKNISPSSLTTRLLIKQPLAQTVPTADRTAQILKRPVSGFTNFFFSIILVIAGYYAFLINQYPKAYRDFFNFSKAFSPTLKEEKILSQRTMNTANALFLWGHSMIVGLVIILFWNALGGIPDVFGFVGLHSFKSSLLSWLILSLIVYVTIGLKYLLIKTLCSLLNFEKIAQIHFFDFFRLSMMFASPVLVVLTVIHLNVLDYQITPYRVLLYVFIALLVARIVVLLLKLIGGSSFRKIHLISYLCTTEILPLLIGVRIFF